MRWGSTPGPPPPSCSPDSALPTGTWLISARCFPLAPGKPRTHQTRRCHPNAVPYTGTPARLRGCRWELSQASAAAHGQRGAPLQPRCCNPRGCHRVRAGIPASRCSSGQPRAGAGGIFPVRVSSRACRQVLYLKLWQTLASGCPPSRGVTTLQSPSHRYCLLPSLFEGHKKK